MNIPPDLRICMSTCSMHMENCAPHMCTSVRIVLHPLNPLQMRNLSGDVGHDVIGFSTITWYTSTMIESVIARYVCLSLSFQLTHCLLYVLPFLSFCFHSWYMKHIVVIHCMTTLPSCPQILHQSVVYVHAGQ